MRFIYCLQILDFSSIASFLFYNGAMIREVFPKIYERRTHPDGVSWFLNTYLIVLDQANVYLDSGLGSKALEELSQNADKSKPNVLIYTHHHFDHVWGSGALTFAKIIAADPFNTLLLEDFDLSYAYYKEIKEGEVRCVYADTLIENKTQLGPLTLIPAPGHSADGLIVFEPKNRLVFMGDNLPDQDKGMLPELDDPQAYRKTLETIRALDAKTLLGCHCEAVSGAQIDVILKSLTSTLKLDNF